MKFTLNWLKEYLDTDASLEQLCDTLTDIGLEVEEVIDRAPTLAPFTVGYVKDAVQHPNADKLRLCTVDIGGGEEMQVVCGAHNARKGIKVVFAREGLTIPANGMVLKPTEIRGVKSCGMMCSEREMGLSDEHDGIMELPEDAPIGEPFAPVLGLDDPIIEIAITPNRPDCLGVYGVARDLAAAGMGTLKTDVAKIEKVAGTFESSIKIDLQFDDAQNGACKQFAGRLIKNVKNGPSPEWLQRRLTAIGLRPISALVDITNYVSYDRCRPLHVYDADKITGKIIARMGSGDEKFVALDGKEYQADPNCCVIADEARVLGFGGVMGGEYSGSQDDTVNVFIESAYFDAIQTAVCGRHTGIQSDARYRNERGIDPTSCQDGVELATKLVMDFCATDATEISEVEIAGEAALRNKKIEFPTSLVKRLSSLEIEKSRMIEILEDLGFKVEDQGDNLMVDAPEWRPDIHGKQDLVEEIVRIYGFDQVESTPLKRISIVSQQVLSPVTQKTKTSRRLLASRGMLEAVTYSFIPDDQAKTFGGNDPKLVLDNPISVDLSTMRPSLLPNLLAASARNAGRGFNDQALFEAGAIYLSDENDGQKNAIAAIRRGTAKLQGQGRDWQGKTANVDVYDIKADLLECLNAIGEKAEKFQIVAEAPDYYHPGRSATLRLGPKNIIAHFGELHPSVLKDFGINDAIVAFELVLDNIPTPKKKNISKGALNLNNLLNVTKDLAFIVDENVSAHNFVNAVIAADKKQIIAAKLFDVYQGDNIEAGKKSMAIEITIKQDQKTLNDDDLSQIMAKVVAKVEKTTKGQLVGKL